MGSDNRKNAFGMTLAVVRRATQYANLAAVAAARAIGLLPGPCAVAGDNHTLGLVDSLGARLGEFNAAAGATDFPLFQATAGAGVALGSAGDGANAALTLTSKGSGAVRVASPTGTVGLDGGTTATVLGATGVSITATTGQLDLTATAADVDINAATGATIDAGTTAVITAGTTAGLTGGLGVTVAATTGDAVLTAPAGNSYLSGRHIAVTVTPALDGGAFLLRDATLAMLLADPLMTGEGTLAYVTNGRKPTEGVGAGTGIPGYYTNGPSGAGFYDFSGLIVTV